MLRAPTKTSIITTTLSAPSVRPFMTFTGKPSPLSRHSNGREEVDRRAKQVRAKQEAMRSEHEKPTTQIYIDHQVVRSWIGDDTHRTMIIIVPLQTKIDGIVVDLDHVQILAPKVHIDSDTIIIIRKVCENYATGHFCAALGLQRKSKSNKTGCPPVVDASSSARYRQTGHGRHHA